MADPGPVAAALWTDAELQASVCLDAVVTVVDARNIERQLAQQPAEGAVNEAQQQIAYADVILLNKVQTCSSRHLRWAWPVSWPFCRLLVPFAVWPARGCLGAAGLSGSTWCQACTRL